MHAGCKGGGGSSHCILVKCQLDTSRWLTAQMTPLKPGMLAIRSIGNIKEGEKCKSCATARRATRRPAQRPHSNVWAAYLPITRAPAPPASLGPPRKDAAYHGPPCYFSDDCVVYVCVCVSFLCFFSPVFQRRLPRLLLYSAQLSCAGQTRDNGTEGSQGGKRGGRCGFSSAMPRHGRPSVAKVGCRRWRREGWLAGCCRFAAPVCGSPTAPTVTPT